VVSLTIFPGFIFYFLFFLTPPLKVHEGFTLTPFLFLFLFVYNSKWAYGINHMLSHPVRAMLESYAIRGPLWSYIHIFLFSSKHVFTRDCTLR
jgi:hypothetical protein